MRPRTSLVLSEIAVHRSRIINDVKPQTSHYRVRPDRMFSALNTSSGMGKVLIEGTSQSQEKLTYGAYIAAERFKQDFIPAV